MAPVSTTALAALLTPDSMPRHAIQNRKAHGAAYLTLERFLYTFPGEHWVLSLKKAGFSTQRGH